MKTGWRKLRRKDRLEGVSVHGLALTDVQAARAWTRLMVRLNDLSDLDSNFTPKFDDLVTAIVASQVWSRRGNRP